METLDLSTEVMLGGTRHEHLASRARAWAHELRQQHHGSAGFARSVDTLARLGRAPMEESAKIASTMGHVSTKAPLPATVAKVISLIRQRAARLTPRFSVLDLVRTKAARRQRRLNHLAGQLVAMDRLASDLGAQRSQMRLDNMVYDVSGQDSGQAEKALDLYIDFADALADEITRVMVSAQIDGDDAEAAVIEREALGTLNRRRVSLEQQRIVLKQAASALTVLRRNNAALLTAVGDVIDTTSALVAIKATLTRIEMEDSFRLRSKIQGLAQQQRKALDEFDAAEKEVVDA